MNKNYYFVLLTISMLSLSIFTSCDDEEDIPVIAGQSEIEVIKAVSTTGVIDGYSYVDLELPSGTMWATCNIGANYPYEYGDYFAWGEIVPKSEYSWSTYKWCEGTSNSLTKYKSGGSILDNADDAAYTRWSDKWRMPSDIQVMELINVENTTTRWATFNKVYGRVITSKKNGNSIFLPAAGYRRDTYVNEANANGFYMTRYLTDNVVDAKLADVALAFNIQKDYVSSYLRYWGLTVRPVLAD